MTKIKRKLFTVFFCLVGVGLSLTLNVSSGFAQPETITYGKGAWSPDNSMIALFDGSPAKNTIHIFTHHLDFVITLYLTDLADEIVQADAFDLAWSPDSTKLAAVFWATDNVVLSEMYTIVWETQFWTETLRLKDSGLYVSWSPDGNYLATGSHIYDAATGEVVHVLGDFFNISYVVWHPTNENQVLLGFAVDLLVYDIETGETLLDYPYYFSNEPAFSPDGRYLAFEQSDNGKAVDILDTSTYELFKSLAYEGSLAERDGINWIGNGKVALRIFESPIRIININTGEVVDTVSIDSGNIWNNGGYRFLARGSALIDNQPALAVFDTYTEEVVAQFVLPSSTAPINRIDWNADGTRLAAVRNDGTLTVYDQSLAFVNEYAISEDTLTSVKWHPTLNYQLAVSTTFGEIFVIDVHSTAFEVIQTFGPEINYVSKVRWSPDGLFLATIGETGGGASSESALHVWDITTGTMVSAYVPFFSLTDLAWNPNNPNELLVTGVEDNAGTPVLLWNPFTGSILWYVEQETGVIYVAWDASGQKFAAFTKAYGGGGAILTIHDAANGDLLQTLPTELLRRSTIMWEPNPFLAVLGERGIQIWDVDKAEIVATLNPEDLGVELAWKPDALDQLTYLTMHRSIEHITIPVLSQTPTAAP